MTEINICGDCEQFKLSTKPNITGWGGMCRSFKVGRNKTTDACKNTKMQEK